MCLGYCDIFGSGLAGGYGGPTELSEGGMRSQCPGVGGGTVGWLGYPRGGREGNVGMILLLWNLFAILTNSKALAILD